MIYNILIIISCLFGVFVWKDERGQARVRGTRGTGAAAILDGAEEVLRIFGGCGRKRVRAGLMPIRTKGTSSPRTISNTAWKDILKNNFREGKEASPGIPPDSGAGQDFTVGGFCSPHEIC